MKVYFYLYPLMFFSRTNFWKIWKRYGRCDSSYPTRKIPNALRRVNIHFFSTNLINPYQKRKCIKIIFDTTINRTRFCVPFTF